MSCVNADLVYCFACFACFDIWLDLANPVAPQFLIEHLSNLSQNQSISSDSILSLHHTTTFHLWRRVPWRFSLMVKLLVCGTHSRTVTLEMLGKMSQDLKKIHHFCGRCQILGSNSKIIQDHAYIGLGGLRGSLERADKACGEQRDCVCWSIECHSDSWHCLYDLLKPSVHLSFVSLTMDETACVGHGTRMGTVGKKVCWLDNIPTCFKIFASIPSWWLVGDHNVGAGYWCAVRRWWWSRPRVIQVPWTPEKEPGNPSNFWRSNSSERIS